LGAERPGITPAERGIAKMMVDLYRSFADALPTRRCSTGTACCSAATVSTAKT
jgi:hypothetical protein